jgi:hypothetical protein
VKCCAALPPGTGTAIRDVWAAVFGANDGLQQPLMGELSYAQTVIGHFGHFELFPSGMGANGGCRTRTGATETVRTTLEIGGQLSAGLCVRC